MENAIRRIAFGAARTAMNAIGLTDCEHYQDMVQAAALKAWELRHMPEIYAWRAAKNAALNEFFFLANESKSHNPAVKRMMFVTLNARPRVSVTSRLDEVIDFDHDERPEPEDDDHTNELFRMFYDMRKKKGERGKQAALVDAQIAQLLLRGWRTAQIAEATGLTINHIKARRRRIRRYLQEICECSVQR